jgi:excisionase family DNA binding protein
MEERHLTVEELAERERTTPATVRYWIHQGTAPRSLRPGRRRLFPLSEVIKWEEKHLSRGDDLPAA